MNTGIKRLPDPKQRTEQNTTSKNGKEMEMNTRINSKRTIIGLAIGTGLIAGLSVMVSAAPTRAFGPADAARAVFVGLVIDESQENGGYVESKLTAPQVLVIDESQENGGYVGSKLVFPQGLVIDESQENGGYVGSKLTVPQGLVIDESQENGSL